MVISLTHANWNSLQLDKPRFESPLCNSDRTKRTTSGRTVSINLDGIESCVI